MLKRWFDVLMAGILIIFTMPLMLAAGFIVLVTSGWPVLFCQQRPGYKGRLFTLYKFRTMRNMFDDNGEPLRDEHRLSFWGNLLRRSSLDELPQLFNVVNGDMSLVGPRPLLVEYLPLYSKNQMKRHNVRPGITGWAQINGRNNLDWDKRLKLDVWYVDNQTFGLDLKILLRTVVKAIARDGINKAGEATVDKFKGTHSNE